MFFISLRLTDTFSLYPAGGGCGAHCVLRCAQCVCNSSRFIFYHKGEKEAAIESLQQAITTLAVLDVAGGAVVQNPWTSLIAEHISTKPQFQNVKKAIANYRAAISRTVSSSITNQDKLIRKVLRKNERGTESLNAAK